MAFSFSIDVRTIGLVRDDSLGKLLGTAFSFIKPTWIVTAKHVVVDYGEPRRQLSFLPNNSTPVQANVLFVHPEVDLAVLEVSCPTCDRPLFPGHHALAGANGLVFAGYAPSKKHPSGGPAIYVNEILAFEVQVRGRSTFDEETIVFAAPDSEGGHSGGPIFGAGGGVVGAVIENYHDGKKVVARGTNLIPLLSYLSFPEKGG